MSFLAKWISGIVKAIPKSKQDLLWLITINPDHAPTVVRASEYRAISPGSAKQFVPTLIPGLNDTINKNYYFLHDARRNYPQTVIFTASELAPALSSGAVLSIVDGDSPAAPEGSSAAVTDAKPQITTESKLPPIINNKYTWRRATPYLQPDTTNPEFSIQGRT
ncbi:hypothetical protein SeMB42_g04015 [Synchytrium endobioticum]|uniref:Uncharacterized protein n=1 Tax=Synchytrium endobioticum TaxID=286115 RepID=A0A507D244_9FUNG|nr:hypothetical protein SeLEV6574_g06054 [Synchytrium endobioticum]TPX45417.1 hypothetical protein SeMB42_g04015 [Synchytrium endobioticum]